MESFDNWAKGVKLDPEIILEIPSDENFKVLFELIQSTKSVPEWVLDNGSSRFTCLKNKFPDEIDSLCDDARHTLASKYSRHDSDNVNQDTDNSGDCEEKKAYLPDDTPHQDHQHAEILASALVGGEGELDIALACAMGVILLLAWHNRNLLLRTTLGSNKSERRLIINSLLLHLCVDPEPLMFHCLERELKLPNVNVEGVAAQSTTPDAIVLQCSTTTCTTQFSLSPHGPKTTKNQLLSTYEAIHQ